MSGFEAAAMFRKDVADAVATLPGSEPWFNGFGLTWRGWHVTPTGNPVAAWGAYRNPRTARAVGAYGKTPAEAIKAAARRRRERRRRA